ncbi:MAG TPA: hypothetical protein PLX89_09425 [Verrucomicrobiota bacterium]|nr:hypothetical protein [Verrucomicrobiales bacterium]HRI13215.1 hypothetical protein [Verrucomicrobiota bacterium]
MIALLVSLLLHLYVWLMLVLVQAALENGWLPPWVRNAVQPLAALTSSTTNAPVKPPEVWNEIPLQFVEVDPAAVTDDAAENAPFFSTANTRAANPNPPEKDQGKPRVDGWREDVLKTFDTPRPLEKPQPAQPKVTEVTPAEPDDLTSKPQPIVEPVVPPLHVRPAVPVQLPAPGQTLLAKADPKATSPTPPDAKSPEANSTPSPPTPKRRPPKRLSEVMPTKGALVGERMKQDGGVQRMAVESSLDVKASPLGDYHYRMVLAVQEQWYRLLEERRFALERIGKVTVTFDLHSDGTITEVATKDSNVGEVLSFLCELSVMQPAPFGRWPAEIRRLIGGDVIPVTFTFNYY